jgi:TetR/AcrR family transcriptional regulator, transcriptional repressor for nem operon
MTAMARTLQAAVLSRQTREELLEAGLRLADELGVRGLSVNAIVEEAARSKGAFFHHFPDRESYLVELHRRIHDEMTAEMNALGEDLPLGRERLAIVVRVYLDTFLARPGVRAFLFEARGEPAIRDEIARRNVLGAETLAADFEALGWRDPVRVARLWIGALAEAGVVELQLGHRDEGTREALTGLALEAPG